MTSFLHKRTRFSTMGDKGKPQTPRKTQIKIFSNFAMFTGKSTANFGDIDCDTNH